MAYRWDLFCSPPTILIACCGPSTLAALFWGRSSTVYAIFGDICVSYWHLQSLFTGHGRGLIRLRKNILLMMLESSFTNSLDGQLNQALSSVSFDNHQRSFLFRCGFVFLSTWKLSRKFRWFKKNWLWQRFRYPCTGVIRCILLVTSMSLLSIRYYITISPLEMRWVCHRLVWLGVLQHGAST